MNESTIGVRLGIWASRDLPFTWMDLNNDLPLDKDLEVLSNQKF